MPKGLRRFHNTGRWHFVTCSCYRRHKFLDSVRRRDVFAEILEEVREKHDFVVAGWVVMPEHFHLLISEPRIGKLSLVMQVLKQRVSRRCRGKRKRNANQMKDGWPRLPPSVPHGTSGCPVLRAFDSCEGRDSRICPSDPPDLESRATMIRHAQRLAKISLPRWLLTTFHHMLLLSPVAVLRLCVSS
jgi:REP element-mobilizing transposase RayT